MSSARLLVLVLLLIPFEASSEPAPQVNGTWKVTYSTAVDWDVPIVGKTRQTIDVEAYWELKSRGRQVQIKEKVCHVELHSGSKLLQMRFHPQFAQGISGQHLKGKIVVGTEGWHLIVPETPRTIGADIPNEAPLPDPLAPETLTDPDKDGEPGIQISLVGVVKANLTAIQRDKFGLVARPKGKDEWTGTVDWTWERRLLSSNNPAIQKLLPETPVRDETLRRFTMTRVEGKAHCPPQ